MNKIEEYKAEKDGLDVLQEVETFAQQGWEAIPEGDRERLKWVGVFFRRQTPGHFMMRIRIPNGISNSAQLRTIAEISGEFGKGFADITTRQQIQLRWFQIEQVPEIWARLRDVGLITLQTGMDNIRNVIGCPVAGLTPNELFDASPVVQQFTEMVVGNRAYTNLPRKFNIAITGCKENCTHAETQDIALTPATKELAGGELLGFNVAVGGKMGSGGYRIASPLDLFVLPGEAAQICSHITLIFRDHGSREVRTRARLAFLIEDWGVEKFREVLEERVGHALPSTGQDAREPNKRTDHIGVFRQIQEGLNYVGLAVPVGRITTDQLLRLAHLAEVYGKGEVRITTGQNLIIPNVPERKLGDLVEEPLLRELRYDPSEIMRGLVSCTGIDYCHFALIETKEKALKTAQQLEQKLGNKKPLTMHWSGCPAGCGNHAVADIGLLGRTVKVHGKIVDAVDVFVGGSAGPEPNPSIKLLDGIPCDDLPQVLEGLIRHGAFKTMRQQLRLTLAQPPLGPALPPKVAPSDKPFIRLQEVGEGTGKPVRLNGTEVAVFKCEGRLYAIENRCPHEGAPLAGGLVEGEEVICPLHAYRFQLKTGACSTDPALRARTFQVMPDGDGFTVQK
jgi:ferredoxin-nitrite reductase